MDKRRIQEVLGLMTKNLECPICLDLLKKPVSTRCDHQFCRFCILQVLQKKRSVPCPLCNKPITERSLTDREGLDDIVDHVRNLINAFQDDSGDIFSPPKGPAIPHFSPGTPSPIKPRNNVRQAKRKDVAISRKTKAVKNLVNKTALLPETNGHDEAIDEDVLQRTVKPSSRRAATTSTKTRSKQGARIPTGKNTGNSSSSSTKRQKTPANQEECIDTDVYVPETGEQTCKQHTSTEYDRLSRDVTVSEHITDPSNEAIKSINEQPKITTEKSKPNTRGRTSLFTRRQKIPIDKSDMIETDPKSPNLRPVTSAGVRTRSKPRNVENYSEIATVNSSKDNQSSIQMQSPAGHRKIIKADVHLSHSPQSTILNGQTPTYSRQDTLQNFTTPTCSPQDTGLNGKSPVTTQYRNYHPSRSSAPSTMGEPGITDKKNLKQSKPNTRRSSRQIKDHLLSNENTTELHEEMIGSDLIIAKTSLESSMNTISSTNENLKDVQDNITVTHDTVEPSITVIPPTLEQTKNNNIKQSPSQNPTSALSLPTKRKSENNSIRWAKRRSIESSQNDELLTSPCDSALSPSNINNDNFPSTEQTDNVTQCLFTNESAKKIPENVPVVCGSNKEEGSRGSPVKTIQNSTSYLPVNSLSQQQSPQISTGSFDVKFYDSQSKDPIKKKPEPISKKPKPPRRISERIQKYLPKDSPNLSVLTQSGVKTPPLVTKTYSRRQVVSRAVKEKNTRDWKKVVPDTTEKRAEGNESAEVQDTSNITQTDVNNEPAEVNHEAAPNNFITSQSQDLAIVSCGSVGSAFGFNSENLRENSAAAKDPVEIRAEKKETISPNTETTDELNLISVHDDLSCKSKSVVPYTDKENSLKIPDLLPKIVPCYNTQSQNNKKTKESIRHNTPLKYGRGKVMNNEMNCSLDNSFLKPSEPSSGYLPKTTGNNRALRVRLNAGKGKIQMSIENKTPVSVDASTEKKILGIKTTNLVIGNAQSPSKNVDPYEFQSSQTPKGKKKKQKRRATLKKSNKMVSLDLMDVNKKRNTRVSRGGNKAKRNVTFAESEPVLIILDEIENSNKEKENMTTENEALCPIEKDVTHEEINITSVADSIEEENDGIHSSCPAKKIKNLSPDHLTKSSEKSDKYNKFSKSIQLEEQGLFKETEMIELEVVNTNTSFSNKNEDQTTSTDKSKKQSKIKTSKSKKGLNKNNTSAENNDVEMEKLMTKINNAEDHDFMFSTQEAYSSMENDEQPVNPAADVSEDVFNGNDGSEGVCKDLPEGDKHEAEDRVDIDSDDDDNEDHRLIHYSADEVQNEITEIDVPEDNINPSFVLDMSTITPTHFGAADASPSDKQRTLKNDQLVGDRSSEFVPCSSEMLIESPCMNNRTKALLKESGKKNRESNSTADTNLLENKVSQLSMVSPTPASKTSSPNMLKPVIQKNVKKSSAKKLNQSISSERQLHVRLDHESLSHKDLFDKSKDETSTHHVSQTTKNKVQKSPRTRSSNKITTDSKKDESTDNCISKLSKSKKQTSSKKCRSPKITQDLEKHCDPKSPISQGAVSPRKRRGRKTRSIAALLKESASDCLLNTSNDEGCTPSGVPPTPATNRTAVTVSQRTLENEIASKCLPVAMEPVEDVQQTPVKTKDNGEDSPDTDDLNITVEETQYEQPNQETQQKHETKQFPKIKAVRSDDQNSSKNTEKHNSSVIQDDDVNEDPVGSNQSTIPASLISQHNAINDGDQSSQQGKEKANPVEDQFQINQSTIDTTTPQESQSVLVNSVMKSKQDCINSSNLSSQSTPSDSISRKRLFMKRSASRKTNLDSIPQADVKETASQQPRSSKNKQDSDSEVPMDESTEVSSLKRKRSCNKNKRQTRGYISSTCKTESFVFDLDSQEQDKNHSLVEKQKPHNIHQETLEHVGKNTAESASLNFSDSSEEELVIRKPKRRCFPLKGNKLSLQKSQTSQNHSHNSETLPKTSPNSESLDVNNSESKIEKDLNFISNSGTIAQKMTKKSISDSFKNSEITSQNSCKSQNNKQALSNSQNLFHSDGLPDEVINQQSLDLPNTVSTSETSAKFTAKESFSADSNKLDSNFDHLDLQNSRNSHRSSQNNVICEKKTRTSTDFESVDFCNIESEIETQSHSKSLRKIRKKKAKINDCDDTMVTLDSQKSCGSENNRAPQVRQSSITSPDEICGDSSPSNQEDHNWVSNVITIGDTEEDEHDIMSSVQQLDYHNAETVPPSGLQVEELIPTDNESDESAIHLPGIDDLSDGCAEAEEISKGISGNKVENGCGDISDAEDVTDRTCVGGTNADDVGDQYDVQKVVKGTFGSENTDNMDRDASVEDAEDVLKRTCEGITNVGNDGTEHDKDVVRGTCGREDNVASEKDEEEYDDCYADLPFTSSPIMCTGRSVKSVQSALEIEDDDDDDDDVLVRRGKKKISAVIESDEEDDRVSGADESSVHLNSSSAFSSQSEVTTQQRGAIVCDIDKMRKEIEELEAEIASKSTHKVIDSDEDEEDDDDDDDDDDGDRDSEDDDKYLTMPSLNTEQDVIPASQEIQNPSSDDSSSDLFLSPLQYSPPPSDHDKSIHNEVEMNGVEEAEEEHKCSEEEREVTPEPELPEEVRKAMEILTKYKTELQKSQNSPLSSKQSEKATPKTKQTPNSSTKVSPFVKNSTPAKFDCSIENIENTLREITPSRQNNLLVGKKSQVSSNEATPVRRSQKQCLNKASHSSSRGATPIHLSVKSNRSPVSRKTISNGVLSSPRNVTPVQVPMKSDSQDSRRSGSSGVLSSPRNVTPVQKPMKSNSQVQRMSVTSGVLTPVNSLKSKRFSKCERCHFATTGLGRDQVLNVKKLAEMNDAKFYSKFNQNVTHLIVKTEEESRVCERTLKFFQGVANKCWILSYSWISDSIEEGRMLLEDSYEILGDTVSGKLHEGPRRSRLSPTNLYNDLYVTCISVSAEMSKGDMINLLESCGATYVENANKLSEIDVDKRLIISCSDTEGTSPSSSDVNFYKSNYKYNDLVTVSREWVFDCIATYEIRPLKDYVLTPGRVHLPF